MDFNQADGLGVEDTKKLIEKYKITSPAGNPLSDPFPFNLMFQTSIGPASQLKAYLRPETAQGIFMNFKRGFEQARQQLPFGIAQIGTAFRNEIAPRNGLLRVREFEQAEIEYFIASREEHCKHFKDVEDIVVNLFDYHQQLDDKPMTEGITIKEAVEKHIIAHEYLGYFIGRCQQFLTKIGLEASKLRFRQHLPKQLAHYAKDCWDCDCLLYCGWTEILGIADRSAYDLQVHSKGSGQDLSAFVKYDEPKTEELYSVKPVMKELAKVFKKDAQTLKVALEEASQEELARIDKEIKETGKFTLKGKELTPAMITLKKSMQTVHGKSVIPLVIEPSFGVGRILYALFEHAFYMRDNDEARTVFKFEPHMAPYRCAVISLMAKDELEAVADPLIKRLRKAGISCKGDDSSVAIGKKYARFDEIGVPYIVTVDYDTLKDSTVTLRERDSMEQARVPVEGIEVLVSELINGNRRFADLKK